MANLQYFILFCSQELKKMYFKKISIGCIITMLVAWCAFVSSVPDKIYMIQGKESVFDLPFQAEVIEENIGVLNVNHQSPCAACVRSAPSQNPSTNTWRRNHQH